MAFRLAHRGTGQDFLTYDRAKKSTQFTRGALLERSSTTGLIQHVSSATAYPLGFLNNIEPRTDRSRPDTDNLTTTWGERAQYEKTAGTRMPIICDIVPTLNGEACGANTTAGEVVITEAGSNDDYTGGICFAVELGEQVSIVDDAQSGGTKTLTVEPPFSRALTTGDTIRAVPIGPGMTQVKLDATNPHLRVSVAVADKTGGHIEIDSVDLDKKEIGIILPQPAAA